MRKDRDSFVRVFAENRSQLTGYATKELPITFAASDCVVYVAMDEGIIIPRIFFFALIESQSLEHADISLAKGF